MPLLVVCAPLQTCPRRRVVHLEFELTACCGPCTSKQDKPTTRLEGMYATLVHTLQVALVGARQRDDGGGRCCPTQSIIRFVPSDDRELHPNFVVGWRCHQVSARVASTSWTRPRERCRNSPTIRGKRRWGCCGLETYTRPPVLVRTGFLSPLMAGVRVLAAAVASRSTCTLRPRLLVAGIKEHKESCRFVSPFLDTLHVRNTSSVTHSRFSTPFRSRFAPPALTT